MGSRFVLPLSIAAALAAGGLVFWFASGRERSRSPSEAPASEASAPARTDELPLAQPSAPAEPEGRAPERAAVELAPPQEAGGPAGASAARATPNVTGRVVDRLGMPVRDARVSAGERLELFREGPTREKVEVRTDADGRFALAWDDAGDVRLGVRASGFAPAERAITLVPDGAIDVGAIVLSQGAILSGRVVDAGGRPVPDAELSSISDSDMGGLVFFGGRRETVARSDRDGSFRIDELACGPWKIAVRSEEHPERTFTGVAPDPGVETTGLVFELEAGTSISGWVTGIPPESTREELSVRAIRVVEGDEFGSTARTAALDPEGRFTLRGLAVDASYDLRLVARERRGDFFLGFGRTRSDTHRARAGDSGVVIAYVPGAVITFQVVDQTTHEPVETFEVEAGIRFPEPQRDEAGRPVRFHPEGRVRFDGLRPAGEGETVTISVRAAGYEDLQQECKLAKGQELDLGQLTFRRVPRVLVHVTDARTGDPIQGARVTLAKDEEGQHFGPRRVEISEEAGFETSLSFGERTATTDEKGDATLTSFEGETCVLSVEAEGFARAEKAGLALPRGEDVEHAFALTGGGDVLVRVFDPEGRPLAGARVSHRSPGATAMMFGGRGKVTDGEGKVRFTGLEPGVHGFQIDDSKLRGGLMMGGDIAFELGGEEGADDESWVEVEVREDSQSEVELHAAPSAELAGTIREGGSPLVGARVSLSQARAGRPRGPMPFGGGEQARTDGHGEYRFSDLKAGRYTVSIEHPTRAMPAELEVEVDVGENELDVELPLSILEGRVTGTDGKPLPGVAVRAERVQAGPQAQFFAISVMNDSDSDVVTIGDGSGPVGATTDAEGRYTLRGVASDVDLVVKASGEGVQEGTSETVSVGPDQTRSGVDLELELAGAVVVEALLADGSAAQMCLVEARYLGEPSVDPEMGFIQSRSTKLTGLRPGAWRLSVSRMGEEDENGGGNEEEVEIVAGETARATVYVE